MYAKMLDVQSHRNLTAVQFGTAERDVLQYKSLDAAIKEKKLEVREVSAAGSVNTLLVVNKADFRVFMMDGDILTGAKQNRVLNTSILLEAGSETKIPVSCVERGRWRQTSAAFSSSGHTAPAMMRSVKAFNVSKNLHASLSRSANQGEVWDGVTLFQMASGTSSQTDDLGEVFAKSEADLQAFLKAFTTNPDANGVAFFVNRRLVSLDLFHRTDIYGEYLPKLVRGIGLVAFHMHKEGEAIGGAEARYRVAEFFDTIDGQEFQDYPGVSLGIERRFGSSEMTGFSLEFEKHPVHLTALRFEPRAAM
jgi:hypothetical protein